ncbi:TPA: hypothetical protein ACKRQG_006287, partial [Pseudomonas aeruginosa]
MARKTKEESQKTRDGILDAAERVFLEGYPEFLVDKMPK